MTASGCLAPTTCPVPDPATIDGRRLRSIVVPAGASLRVVAGRVHWPSLFNPTAAGDARFSPLARGGSIVPTAYLTQRSTVALLETAFHDVGPLGSNTISEAIDLAPRVLARVTVPDDLRLVDLGDAALDRVGLDRSQIVSTSAAHHPCTRQWAEALHGRKVGGRPTHGLAWRSRVVEVAGSSSPVLADVEPAVMVVFGDTVTTAPDDWSTTVVHDDLVTGPGRYHVEQIASLLGATIV